MKFLRKSISAILISILLAVSFLNIMPVKTNAYEKIENADENVIKSKVEYVEYQETDDFHVTEGPFAVAVSNTKKSKEDQLVDRFKLLGSSIGLGALPTSYKTTGIKIKNQGNTGECWAFTATTGIEAYNLTQGRVAKEYSPRHMDYSCSKSFTNVSSVTKTLFNRETTANVGSFFLVMAYLGGGNGPVLESNYPFSTDVTTKVPYESLDIKKEELVQSVLVFPAIYKQLSGNTITYYTSDTMNQTTQYSSNEVSAIRNQIKTQIKEYGAVSGMVCETMSDGNNIYTPADSDKSPNHAITIVGWNDEYIVSGWRSPGAYICQNSYGDQMFDNGYVYVSYDDKFIEQFVVGYKDVKDYDIENVYEYDECGSFGVVRSSTLNNDSYRTYDNSEITAVNIFDRGANAEDELLTKVGFTSWSIQKAEVYVTENFDSAGEPYNFTKVKSLSDTFIEGAYILDLDTPYKLTQRKYAVAVRFVQDNEERVATAACETGSTSSSNWWYLTKSNPGESYFVDLFNQTGENLFVGVGLSSVAGRKANASVKAFTQFVDSPVEPDPPPQTNDPEDMLVSTDYTINGKYRRITMVEEKTDLSDFLDKISINSNYPELANKEITVTDKDGTVINDGIIKTGYKVLVSESEYEVAVRGDVNCDGEIGLLDLLVLRGYLVGFADSLLTGIRLYAGDINGSGEININDVSVMRNLLVQ